MNDLSITKKVVTVVAGIGVNFVISGALKSLVPTETNYQKIKFLIGSTVLSALIVDHVKHWAETTVDDTFELIETIREGTSTE